MLPRIPSDLLILWLEDKIIMVVSHSLKPLAGYSLQFIAATSSHLVIVICTACHTTSVFLYIEMSYYAVYSISRIIRFSYFWRSIEVARIEWQCTKFPQKMKVDNFGVKLHKILIFIYTWMLYTSTIQENIIGGTGELISWTTIVVGGFYSCTLHYDSFLNISFFIFSEYHLCLDSARCVVRVQLPSMRISWNGRDGLSYFPGSFNLQDEC